MTPYYEHGGITIYHGDCREILPFLQSVDLLLTDPPYGVSQRVDSTRFTNRRGDSRVIRAPVAGDDEPFDPSFLLSYGQHQIIWGWNNYPDKLPRGACLVWLKRYDEAFGSFLSDAELAWMSKGYGVYCTRDLSNNVNPKTRSHPTQKPVSLIGWCLTFFQNAQLVLDPFMGSGSTLVAARNHGRKAIGIELEERYCEIAAKRLSQEVLPL